MRPGGLFSFGRALIAVTLLAGALRFLRLGQVPVSLYCDEAFNAYQAWSLLLTGRDTRGVWMPLFFDIFGKGWGEPLYFYLTVPSVAIMGLTPFAARATAALAGTIAVAATGLMTRALLSDATSRRTAGVAGIAAAASMAVSPWAHHFSRIGFQASLMPALLAAGFWMARGGLGGSARRRTTRLVLGSLTLGLSLYSYAVSRLALPLLLAGFIVLYRDKVRRRAGAAGVAAAIVILMAAPMAWFSLSPAGQQRFSDVSIVNAPELDGAGPAAVAARVSAHYVS